MSLFAIIGSLFKPKSFAGLFSAAPSVALATLSLTVAVNGPAYSATEGRSMVVGALAFVAYATVVCRYLGRRGGRPRTVATISTVVWVVVASGGWMLLRATV